MDLEAQENKKIVDMEQPIIYTIDDIRNIFSLGKNKAYALMNSSGFPSFKIGKKIYSEKKSLDKWIAELNHKTYLI